MSTTIEPGQQKPVPNRLQNLIFQREGQLTRDLLLQPSGFGLGQLPTNAQPTAVTQMVCGYCATGCGLNVHLKDGEAISLSPSTEYPVNLGMACPKGWEALTVLDSKERATMPLLRNANGKLEPVDWHNAMKSFVQRFQKVQTEHGPDSVAFISTGQMATEEMALLGAVTKFGMGMLHGDGNTRQCMATAVVSYKQSFGFDAPPYTYQDFEESDVIVLVGSNLCLAHPIMWERVMRNRNNPEIVVIDPRMTETAMQATQHLSVYPKSDQALLYGIAKILIDNNWIAQGYIEAHTNSFVEFAEFVGDYTLDVVTEATRLSAEQVTKLAETIHQGKRVSFWWTMGVNQSYQGVRTAQAIINLALMTGNIGRPGTGANSITGQCNAMGSRLFSNTTNLLGGHDFLNAEHRQKIADILEIDAEKIPDQNSKSYNEIMEGILRGKIKGLWVVCTNPAHSWINQNLCRDILDRLDFLVVQDMYHNTESAQVADLVLPAAAWGEKEGTFINSERRLGVLKKVSRAPGQAITDFNIFRLVAEYWGCGEMFAKWKTPADVFEILKACSKGQPCDISGIEDYQMIDERNGIQWPYAADGSNDAPERRLFEDGKFYHDDGKARFICEKERPLPEPPNEKYPLILLTGRGSASQWHTQTRTRNSAVLRKLYPEKTFVEISPVDAKQLNIQQSEQVTVASQRGRISAHAFLTNAVKPGQVFMPMHYDTVNQLTDAVFDPYSKQPSYKACAVRVSK